MHLLYLDGAGSVSNPDDKHIVLAGVSVFERQAHWLRIELDRLAENLTRRLGNPTPQALEFHGNPIRKGDGWWRNLTSPVTALPAYPVSEILNYQGSKVKAPRRFRRGAF